VGFLAKKLEPRTRKSALTWRSALVPAKQSK
jgi:hypothetical protein